MKRLTKDLYIMLNKRHDTMLHEGIRLAEKMVTDLNLKKITRKEYDQKIGDWENEIFAIAFQLWHYDLQKSFAEYRKVEKAFILNHKMGFIDVINAAPAGAKVNFKLYEKIKKLMNEIVEDSYKKIVRICKQVPVHGIDKNKFPLPPIDLVD